MAVDHYENFPVASILLPARLREPVRDIYRFARSADDIADEGDAAASARLESLAGYRNALEQIQANALDLPAGDPRHAVFAPLAGTIARFGLPFQPFFDLLSAFEQDVATQRYADRAALLDYCRRSANPVGRLMLHLYGRDTTQAMAWSDAVCTGLQLVNFWQDVALDWQKSRLYIPQTELTRFGLTEQFIVDRVGAGPCGTRFDRTQSDDARTVSARTEPAMAADRHSPEMQSWTAMMRTLAADAENLLRSGLPLTRMLPARAGFELKLVIFGGLRILERLDQLHYDIFTCRPTLGKRDWVIMFGRALLARPNMPASPAPGQS